MKKLWIFIFWIVFYQHTGGQQIKIFEGKKEAMTYKQQLGALPEHFQNIVVVEAVQIDPKKETK